LGLKRLSACVPVARLHRPHQCVNVTVTKFDKSGALQVTFSMAGTVSEVSPTKQRQAGEEGDPDAPTLVDGVSCVPKTAAAKSDTSPEYMRSSKPLTKKDLDDQSSRSSGGNTRCPVGSDGGENESHGSSSGSREVATTGASQAGGPSDKDESSRDDPSDRASSEEGGACAGRAEAGEAATAEVESAGIDPTLASEVGDEVAVGHEETGQRHFDSLERNGPQESLGSRQHPEGCKPCAFYCYSLCGCRNGPSCIFCHLFHESKLRQRREEWKRAQREKRGLRRKAAREGATTAVEAEVATQMSPTAIAAGTSIWSSASKPFESFERAVSGQGFASQSEPMRVREVTAAGPAWSAQHFPYVPRNVTLTVGTAARIAPPEALLDAPRVFSVIPDLPDGLIIERQTGVIHGTPKEATSDMVTFLVTACRRNEGATTLDVLRGVVTIKVVDATAHAGSSLLANMAWQASFSGGRDQVAAIASDAEVAYAGGRGQSRLSPETCSSLHNPGAIMMKSALAAERDFADARSLVAGVRWS